MSDVTATPVTLGQAMSMVEAWEPGFGFQLHRIAHALYMEVCRLQAERDAVVDDFAADCAVPAVDEMVFSSDGSGIPAQDHLVERDDIIERFRKNLLIATDGLGQLARERDEARLEYDRILDLSEADERRWKKTIKSLTVERDVLQEKLITANDKLLERNDEIESLRATIASTDTSAFAVMTKYNDKLAAERDQLKADYAKLDYQTRMMGVSLADKPDGYGSSAAEAYPLTRVIDLMDGWRDGVERWGLHQMCRVLRVAYETLAAAAVEAEAEIDALTADIERALSTIAEYDAAEQRALASVPCARGKDDCHAPDYLWAPCCNLRIALLPGEPFQTDYLADSGEIHLFKPGKPEYPGAPLASDGCVKLIEPTIFERNETLDWNFRGLVKVGVVHNGAGWVESALNLSCTETSNDV